MRKIYILHMTATLLLVSVYSMSQTLKAKVSGTIVPAVLAAKKAQLTFGTFSVLNNDGVITVMPDGTRENSNTVRPVDKSYSAGRFLIGGAPNSRMTVMLPSGPLKLNGEMPGQNIVLDNWTTDLSKAGNELRLLRDKLEINIGATLYISGWAQKHTGVYEGTYQVVFIYN